MGVWLYCLTKLKVALIVLCIECFIIASWEYFGSFIYSLLLIFFFGVCLN